MYKMYKVILQFISGAELPENVFFFYSWSKTVKLQKNTANLQDKLGKMYYTSLCPVILYNSICPYILYWKKLFYV